MMRRLAQAAFLAVLYFAAHGIYATLDLLMEVTP